MPCNNSVIKMGVTKFTFKLPVKTEIKVTVVFQRSYYCYGNLLYYKKFNIKTTCSPMIGQLFDSLIVASTDKEGLFKQQTTRFYGL